LIDWNNKKVLVAGGAGMIGSHLAKRLHNEGAEVTIADALSSGSLMNLEHENGIKFFNTDLRLLENCLKVTNNNEYVFQLAADMGGIGYITKVGADLMFNNSLINLNMLRAARQANVPNYFFSSSACVYPAYKQTTPEVIPLKESDSDPAEPDQFYGWEKLYCEKLVKACQRDYSMNIKLARFHNIYGEVYTAFDKQKGKAPCHLIIKAIKHPNPPFAIWGDGKSTRSFMYVDDCIESVLRLMDTNYLEPINIGSNRLVTVDELANIIIDISGKQITPIHELDRPQGVRGRNCDPTIMQRVLGYSAETKLEDGLAKTYEWAIRHYSELENIN
jgi:GDP-D-mannose 3', 5'-epimerase